MLQLQVEVPSINDLHHPAWAADRCLSLAICNGTEAIDQSLTSHNHGKMLV